VSKIRQKSEDEQNVLNNLKAEAETTAFTMQVSACFN